MAQPDIESLRYRDRQREVRRRAFLDTARYIVNTEGERALTMQRVTQQLGSSTGGIYNYFPTKSSLVAELQREALDVLTESFLLGQSRLADWLAQRDADPADAALAQAMAACWFWIDSEVTLPSEIELSRRLIAGADAEPIDPGTGALAAALRLLEEARQRLDATVELGVLDPGNSVERSLTLVASVTGVLLTSKLGGWDNALFDGRRLAIRLVDDILAGWGADRGRLVAAGALLDAFAEHDQIAPPIDRPYGV